MPAPTPPDLKGCPIPPSPRVRPLRPTGKDAPQHPQHYGDATEKKDTLLKTIHARKALQKNNKPQKKKQFFRHSINIFPYNSNVVLFFFNTHLHTHNIFAF